MAEKMSTAAAAAGETGTDRNMAAGEGSAAQTKKSDTAKQKNAAGEVRKGKYLYIAEKPSVAREFAGVLGERMTQKNGYTEGEHSIVTWCFGHLVTMSYPEVYDEKYKRWRLETLPFLPEKFLYEVIGDKGVKEQFDTVKSLLNRSDVSRIYVCTDSGREGEYIYRLVRQQAGVHDKEERRVWINSQTEEEIKRGISEAKDLSEYDSLSDAAYLRAKEDYLIGINFSRLLTLKYAPTMASFLKRKHCVVSVGRVMTCVLGMVVRREHEIRAFVKTPFYRVIAGVGSEGVRLDAEWKAAEGSAYENSPLLYKENGFKEEDGAKELIASVCKKDVKELSFDEERSTNASVDAVVSGVSNKSEKKNAPLLYNLAELQNDCSKMFKISPDETLKIVQELYEKKLVTYPRTDARVLSSAIAKEITKNLNGLKMLSNVRENIEEILSNGWYKNLAKTRYVNDKAITDHYAIIPTGAAVNSLAKQKQISVRVYELIVRRFLAIFYPAAVYRKLSAVIRSGTESFFINDKYLKEEGYLAVMHYSFLKEKEEEKQAAKRRDALALLKKGAKVTIGSFTIKEGETSPPKRYSTGSMILAMENAGKLIEDEDLREQISGSGIGTSATRADILEKLVRNDYLRLNKKTQVLTPSLQGEMVYYVVKSSISSMLDAEFTAGWERGLTKVWEGSLGEKEYYEELKGYISRRTKKVMELNNANKLKQAFSYAAGFYGKKEQGEGVRRQNER